MEETSTIHGKTMRSDYEDLQYHIDMVVGKIGLQKTVVLLRSFVEKAQFEPVKNNAPLLLTFLTNEAIALFDLKLVIICITNTLLTATPKLPRCLEQENATSFTTNKK